MRIISTIGIVGLLACTGTKTEPASNTAPVFTNISITPSTNITTSTELLCVATATDAENDVLSLDYQWTDADGNVLSDADTLTLSPEQLHPTAVLTCTATVSDGSETVTDQTSVTIENTLPVVSNVAISPREIFVDSLLECSFVASDADLEELTVSYSWTQNGTEVGTGSSLQLNSSEFFNDDVIVCTVTVEDGYQGTVSASAQAIVGNTAPVIGSASITPESPYSYDTLTCTANDVVDGEDDALTISYVWSIDGQVQTETSDTLTGPFTVDAVVSCQITANDGQLDSNTASASVTIVNTAPVVDSISVSPMTNVEANTALTCSATGSDVDMETVTMSYAWTLSDGTVLGTADTLQLDNSMVSPEDTIVCTATATDPHGATNSQSTTVSVINTNPVVDAVATITGNTTTGSTLTCSAAFSDLNDGTLLPSFVWTNQAGTVLSTTDTYTISATDTNTGENISCTASVVDADGATVSSSASVTVTNTAPTMTGLALTPDPAVYSDSLMCSVASTADIDEETVTLSYSWSVDGATQAETSDTLAGPFNAGAVVTCSVTPNDGTDNGLTDSVSITISNTVPMVDSVELVDNGTVYTDGSVVATSVLSDVNAEQTLTANYAWHVIDASNGGLDSEVQTGTSDTLDGSLFDKDDQVYVVVTANDGVDNSAPVTSSSVTIMNSAPTGITASVTSSDMFYNNSTLTCAATASDIDPEDAVLTYTYAWSTGDVGLELILDGSMMPGADVTCTATATDGSGASISVDATETLVNRPATVDSVTLPQDVTTETTSIFCDATGSDLDGETPTLTYAWTINGQANAETSNTLTDSFMYQDVIVCTVTSADATGTGSSMDATTTVLNTAPVVDSVALTPATVYTNDTITATSVLSDVDAAQAGSLTANYEWFVNGASVQNGASNTLDGSLFDKDDQVYVVVTANDGVDNSTPVMSSSVTIMNSAPTGITASVTSSDMFYNNSTLTCAATASDIDPEDAVLTYTYAWSTGDVGLELILDGSMMPGADVTCTATATDGSGASISVDATETLVNRPATVDSVTLPQDVTTETTSIFCDATGSDLDGETPTLTYAWTTNGQPLLETSNTLTNIFTYQDVIVCTVTSTDPSGAGSSMNATTTVLNTAPVVGSVTLIPSTVYTNTTIIAASVLSDVDAAQNIIANYEWFVNGALVQNGFNDMLDGSLFDKDDQVYVVVTANDGVDNSAPVTSSSITIANTTPSNPLVSVTSSNAFYNDSTLTCSMTAEDMDVVVGTDTLTYTYAWSTGDTGADLVLSGSLVPTTNITCTATATDSSGASVSGTATATLGNRAPTVDSISLPATATAATTSLLCSATASDLDGTTPSLSYVWTIDGNPLTESTNTLTGPFVYGEVIGCTAFADDGISTGTGSTSVSISNTAPTVNAIALTPATVYTNDTITATVLVSDIDTAQAGSLTANYEWFVNGALVQNGSSNTLDGVSMFDRDQNVYVVVTANDGLENSTPVQSNTITIANSAPVLTVSVGPNAPMAGDDDLVCTVSATDADNDAILYTYEWYNTAGLQQDEVNTSSLSNTFTGSNTTPGTWTCYVDATDGTDTTTNSASLSVSTPVSSCLELLQNDPTLSSGLYTISPNGSNLVQVYCDMTTDSGGYDSYLVTGGASTYRYTDNNSCPDGMDIVVPRTQAHWNSLIATHGTSSFPFIPGIYGTSPGSYTSYAMNSEDVPNWYAVDGGNWWLRNTSYSEPNGDYTAGCWLGSPGLGNTSSITFNDGGCSYGGSTYVCSTNAKDAPENCLDILAIDDTSPSGTYTIYPNGAKAVSVYCDMTTDGGGYDSYLVTGGASTYRYTDNNSCPDGMDIVVPRTQAHWTSLVATHGTSSFPFIPGIYGTSPGNYTGSAMKAGSVSNWYAVDGGNWWLRDTSYSEPSGDYSAGCWLGTRSVSSSSNITFNDEACNYGGSTYVCSTNAKDRQSCADLHQENPNAPSGTYTIYVNGGTYNVYCDMTTDDGGWTLVGSSYATTMNDEASGYYADLASATPSSAHTGVWNGLRGLTDDDIRFTCTVGSSSVDLSFYETQSWYDVITTGSDANSCFNDNNGAGQLGIPGRKNNRTGETRLAGDQWDIGHLEGEYSCEDTSDFTVDFDDRGMDSNEQDGTDWGEDDGRLKCGTVSGNGSSGYWQIWVR